LVVWKAQSFGARLLGLHWVPKQHRQQTVLWFPRCRAVHTFALSSAHTLVYLDAQHRVLAAGVRMRANRFYCLFKAQHVLEMPATYATYSMEALQEVVDVLLAKAKNI